ncbi:MAG: pseudouridine synthase [Neisseriaceae bacterium]|jgi:23S rRNA pseudouridine2457 synthase|nr:MAG: pseudouridine synthase [Neisseriaceae bacterium]
MTRIILFNKPCGVISQFSPSDPYQTLKDFIPITNVYPAGRLDTDSEGLMILTDNGQIQSKITEPKHNKFKTYLVQVEGLAEESQIEQLRNGIKIDDYFTKSANVEIVADPDLWERVPSIRFRKNKPTSWLSISISEGKNRQVRRMTAAVGLPTLRLVRISIGGIQLEDLALGEYKEISQQEFMAKF